MSQKFKGIFGALAVAVSFGAIQYAFGHDLMGGKPGAPAATETGINRAAKADRAAVPAFRMQTQTIALRPDGLADTSILIRTPAQEARNEARDRLAPRPAAKPGKISVACEPPVSVLTDVAKLLQPGRCVT
jgi:hypothetical protein